MNTDNQSLKNYGSESQKETKPTNDINNSFFCDKPVKKSKDAVLKIRFDTLIKNAGFTQSEFYEQVGISRQYFYFISWGLWECPIELKIKIARVLNTDSALIFQGVKNE